MRKCLVMIFSDCSDLLFLIENKQNHVQIRQHRFDTVKNQWVKFTYM